MSDIIVEDPTTVVEETQSPHEEEEQYDEESIREMQKGILDVSGVMDWYHQYVADLIYQADKPNFEPERLGYMLKDPETTYQEFERIMHAVDAFEQLERVVESIGYVTLQEKKDIFRSMDLDETALELLDQVQEWNLMVVSEDEKDQVSEAELEGKHQEDKE